MNYTVNPEYEKMMPKLSAEEFDALKQSIKEDGQFYPIIVNGEGVILDGHHRNRACNELGITPKVSTTIFKNKFQERIFVIDTNLKRRNLNEYQILEFKAEIIKLKEAEAKSRQSTGGNAHISLAPIGATQKGKSADIISTELGVSGRTFERAKVIMAEAPEKIKEKLRSGELSISGVYDNIQLTKSVPTLVKADVESNIEQIKTVMRAENVDTQADKQQVMTKLVEVAKQGTITSLDIKKAVATTKVESVTKSFTPEAKAKTMDRVLQKIEQEDESSKIQVMDVAKDVEREEIQTLAFQKSVAPTIEQELDIENYRKELSTIQNSSSAQTNLAKNKNWLAHGQIMAMQQTLRCPCCGKTIEELVWKCCGIKVKDAYTKLGNKQ
jgi:hypothetical protein